MSFTFPKLPRPTPLQNPLLSSATVTDRAAAGEEDMGGAAAKLVAIPAGPAPRRGKVPFEIGYSQVDWIQLTRTHPDLAGLGGERPRKGITLEEVAQHRTTDDAWTVLRGKVYNIGPYLKFHPGGAPILMKVAGKDGTALFSKYHPWVNAEFMLAKCMVGWLAPAFAQSAAAAGPGSATLPGIPGDKAEPAEAAGDGPPSGSSSSSSQQAVPNRLPSGDLRTLIRNSLER